MNTVELLQFSLQSALSILKQVTEDLTQEQADWTPPGIVDSIGTQYWHVISSVDQIVHGWVMGQAPLFEKEGWQERVIVETLAGDKDRQAQLQAVRVDLPVMHEYARAVAKSTRAWLDALTTGDLERKVNTSVGELSLAQLLATFIIWHVSAHSGEISALKGCQGAKGYPF
jgi:hypothetical protein